MKLKKIPKKNFTKNTSNKDTSQKNSNPTNLQIVSNNIADNKQYLQHLLSASHDIVYRFFYLGNTNKKFLLVYVNGMADRVILNDQILDSLMSNCTHSIKDEQLSIKYVEEHLLTSSQVNNSSDFNDLVTQLLSGNTLLFLDTEATALSIGSKAKKGRDVGDPISEETLRGPRDGFVESMRNNIVFIRRRIKDPNLAVEMLQVGTSTKTSVAVVYLRHIANTKLVKDIKNRVNKINLDGIIGSAQIEQMIEDRKWNIFPQILATERPDKVSASILEGRVALIVDGTPFVLIIPATFGLFLNNPDDYYERAFVTSLIRLTRYISYFLSISLPGIYIALVEYHPGMIPTSLALSITGTRIGLPFPTFVEVISMELIVQILLEAAVRLPKPIAQSVSIVGGLVIGQAVVQAGIISPVVVIIVAVTAMFSFTIPVYTFSQSNKVMRIPIILAGALMGLYGVIAVLIFIIIHMASLESFNTRYLGEFSPLDFNNLKDTLVKVPNDFMNRRPTVLNLNNKKRQGSKKVRKNKGNASNDE